MEHLKEKGFDLALLSGEEAVITDARSAMELALEAQYTLGADRLVIDKRVLSEDFFVLRTGLAGEVLQKFINYRVKAAVYGDFSGCTSKPLRDFIYESNQGRDFFFVSTREEAIEKLTAL